MTIWRMIRNRRDKTSRKWRASGRGVDGVFRTVEVREYRDEAFEGRSWQVAVNVLGYFVFEAVCTFRGRSGRGKAVALAERCLAGFLIRPEDLE